MANERKGNSIPTTGVGSQEWEMLLSQVAELKARTSEQADVLKNKEAQLGKLSQPNGDILLTSQTVRLNDFPPEVTLYNPTVKSITKSEIEFKKQAPKFNMQACAFSKFLKLFEMATHGYRISKDCYKVTLFQSLLGSAAMLAQGCDPLEQPYAQMSID